MRFSQKTLLKISAFGLLLWNLPNAHAMLIDNGNYTTDTVTGLDWLDLTATRGESFDNIVAQMGPGGTYAGWRHATREEVKQFWINAGGAAPFTGAVRGSTNWVGQLQSIWGKTYPFVYSIPNTNYTVQGTIAMTANRSDTCDQCNLTVYLLDNLNNPGTSIGDYAEAEQLNEAYRWQWQVPIGHALVRSSFTPYPFGGFLPPIYSPPVSNNAKAGSAIPVKFSLGGFRGLNIFSRPPQVQTTSCNSGQTLADVVDTVTAGASSFNYDAVTDTYVYVWKSEKSWSGSCRRLDIQFNDGSEKKSIQFSFR
jgi:hypothetical protein